MKKTLMRLDHPRAVAARAGRRGYASAIYIVRLK